MFECILYLFHIYTDILIGRGDDRYWILMYYGNWNVNFEFLNEILSHFCIMKDNSRTSKFGNIWCQIILESNAWGLDWVTLGLHCINFYFTDTEKVDASLSWVFLYKTCKYWWQYKARPGQANYLSIFCIKYRFGKLPFNQKSKL